MFGWFYLMFVVMYGYFIFVAFVSYFAAEVDFVLDTNITKITYNVGKTKFTNYTKNILKINIYTRKTQPQHLRVHSKLNLAL